MKAQSGGTGTALPLHKGNGWSASRPGRFTSGKRPGTHCIESWVGVKLPLALLTQFLDRLPCILQQGSTFWPCFL